MGRPLVAILFAVAIYMTLYRGAVVAFVTLYLPALLLLNTTQKINLPGLPDMNATYGIIYGILGGLVLKGGEAFPFRWGWVDTWMLMMTLSTVITGMVTEFVYTGVSIFGEQVLGYLAPYFLTRCLFHSPAMRRRALWICVWCAFIIAFFALIEMRLTPYFLSRQLKSVGLFTGASGEVLKRWGLMRAQVSFDHPIDLGNAALLVAALIAILAMTTSVGLKNIYVRLAVMAAFCSSLSSLAFTAWTGIGASCAMFCVLWLLPFTRHLVVVAVLILFCGLGFMTYKLYNTDVDQRQQEEHADIGQTAQDSMLVRALIIQNCMPFATTAGPFGYGNTIHHADLALESVDNSYMLFTMRRGWMFLGLLLTLPLVLAVRTTRALSRAKLPAQWMPLCIGISTVLGIMAAMFTVWFGFAYSVLWVMMIAMTVSMCEVLINGAPSAAVQPAGRARQFSGAMMAMGTGA